MLLIHVTKIKDQRARAVCRHIVVSSLRDPDRPNCPTALGDTSRFIIVSKQSHKKVTV